MVFDVVAFTILGGRAGVGGGAGHGLIRVALINVVAEE